MLVSFKLGFFVKSETGQQRVHPHFELSLYTEHREYETFFDSHFTLSGYMSLLRRQYSSKRVLANDVYVEYISNRHHMHMNATCWETLTQFVHHLAKRRLIKAEDSEKGWYITYIDRDPWLQEKVFDPPEVRLPLQRNICS